MTEKELSFFRKMLEWDSTSGKEREFSEWLAHELSGYTRLERFEVGDGTQNLLACWGEPRVVFCTHMDTMPPYIAPQRVCAIGSTVPSPQSPDDVIFGRGACDAKGQIAAMLSACMALESDGRRGFGLLLLSGEETGSWGAKAFAKTGFRAPYLIVGEPTENKLVSAAKGTKSYDLQFKGEAFHSGYPEYGVSAVDIFNEFCNILKAKDFGEDPLLGKTTWNIGLLESRNPQNILSESLTCRLYFRTTFSSDAAVQEFMDGKLMDGRLKVTARGGDAPQKYMVPEGFECAPVAFGSDAPHLSNFEHKIICGPGSIRHAHRDDEQISLGEIEAAVAVYVKLYKKLNWELFERLR